MIKIWKNEDLKLIQSYPIQVFENVDNIINILNEYYGEYRDMHKELGGYICIVECIKDVQDLKSNILKGLVEEFSDIIHEDEVNIYSSTLYILSSDYSVTVISKNEETEYLLK